VQQIADTVEKKAEEVLGAGETKEPEATSSQADGSKTEDAKPAEASSVPSQ
jgi:hypothetical protein